MGTIPGQAETSTACSTAGTRPAVAAEPVTLPEPSSTTAPIVSGDGTVTVLGDRTTAVPIGRLRRVVWPDGVSRFYDPGDDAA